MESAEPFFGFGILFREGSVFVQKPGEGIAVDPDLIVSFFLGFVEDKLHPPMEMDGFNVIHIFFGAIARVPHVADHIAGSYNAAFFESKGVWEILAQMGIVIIAFAIEAADANTPAPILVPAKGFHIAGLYCDDGRTNLAHHVMA